MAHGIPVIATNTHSNAAVMSHGVEGFLAETRGQWVEYLSILKDGGTREVMSTAGHVRALANFDSKQWSEMLARRVERYL